MATVDPEVVDQLKSQDKNLSLFTFHKQEAMKMKTILDECGCYGGAVIDVNGKKIICGVMDVKDVVGFELFLYCPKCGRKLRS